MKLLPLLKYPKISCVTFPFKCYNKAIIRIKGADITLNGRLTIGNKDKLLVSGSPTNIQFDRDTVVEFGHSITLGPGVNLIVKQGAQLKIGNESYITSNTHIEAVNRIEIGEKCAISWGVTIIDDDHHVIEYSGKKPASNNDVIIGNRVWIGCDVTILKGTKIGEGCVVAAGSVVKGEFPKNTLIAGNPAKIVKSDVNWK